MGAPMAAAAFIILMAPPLEIIGCISQRSGENFGGEPWGILQRGHKDDLAV